MKLTYEQFKKYIKDNGVTDARTTEDCKAIPKGTLIKFGLQQDGTITSWESLLEGQEQYKYIFCTEWTDAWTVYKGLFEVEDKEFKIGDRVKLITYRYGVSAQNPVWGDKQGDIVGTIQSIESLVRVMLPIKVIWDNGEKNSYSKEHLSLVEESSAKADNLELRVSVKTQEEWNAVYGKSFYDVFLEEIKAYKYTMELNPINQLTKPKGNKYMSIISNAFKSKENKALEYFNLGTTETLSELGRQEFIDFLWETLKEEKKAFLSKMVEAYKEDKE